MKDLNRLPKWAQQRIQLLERDLASALRKLDGYGKPMQYREPGVGYDEGLNRRKIPADTVSFVNSAGVRFTVRINRHDLLEVNSSGYLDRMVIYPEASNHFCCGDSGALAKPEGTK